MVRQYLRIKSQHQDAILFYRMGDFYEMFFDDARTASRILNIALTSRDKDKTEPIPLCGVPYHSAENYISRLVREGHKVAICEQIGVVQKGTKLVRREVVRVITPGTILSDGYLSEKQNNFLAAVNPVCGATGLAFLDISTGDFLGLEIPDGRLEELPDRMADFEPAELVIPEGTDETVTAMLGRTGSLRPKLQRLDPFHFEGEKARRALMEQFGTSTLEPFGLGPGREAVLGAAGAVLRYALDTQKQRLGHVNRIVILTHGSHLEMDAATQRNLELVRSALTGGREGTLLSVLDETLTPMGGRSLRQCILRPLTDAAAVNERLETVAELIDRFALAEDLRRGLKSVLDLERLIGRITLGLAGPRDLLALKSSLVPLPGLRQAILQASSGLLGRLLERLDALEDVRILVEKSIRDDAPATVKDGDFIKPGYDPLLDDWLAVKHQGRKQIAGLEAGERERTGIGSLKIRYNRIFGYFLEVTKANLKDVPPDYMRKQTLVGAERFTFPALTEYETRILEADEKSLAREMELFAGICAGILSRAPRVAETCRALAELDVLQSLARTAVRYDYCRPVIDDGDVLDIREGRHPVVERVNTDEAFIPNDCLLNTSDRQMLIITGPNMAGKSTYLRQVALTVLMAQMGGFVPAKEARIGIVDRIFTRVGATDYLVRGQSTFMVEMTETAYILNNATPRSLIVLDEIGRGTSTFDGLSIAWAVAEYLHDTPDAKARTLFATHYHQLTELALTLPGVSNCSTAVREWGDRIIFLRKIVEGGTDKSYGIQVARLAGLPPSVIARSKEIMANLEEGELNTAGLPRLADHHQGGADAPPSPEGKPSQLYLFGSPEEEVITRLGSLEPDQLTPLEGLNLLAELVKKLRRYKS